MSKKLSFVRWAYMKEVEDVLDTTGWKGLITLSCEAMSMIPVVYRWVDYTVTARQLNDIFGWTTTARDKANGHSNNEAWEALTRSRKKFQAGRSHGAKIREPKLFYL